MPGNPDSSQEKGAQGLPSNMRPLDLSCNEEEEAGAGSRVKKPCWQSKTQLDDALTRTALVNHDFKSF